MFDRSQHIISINLSGVRSSAELHKLLINAFAFPAYYGTNWDAFDECIRSVELPPTIEVTGLEEMRAHLPRDAQLLKECLRTFAAEAIEHPCVHVT